MGDRQDEVFKEAKSLIKSVLTSSQKALTLPELCKDYREVIGTPIPIRDSGHPDLLSFLQAMPDILSVHDGRVYQNTASVKANHIANLVAHQKSSKKPKSAKRHVKPSQFYRQVSNSNIQTWMHHPGNYDNQIFFKDNRGYTNPLPYYPQMWNQQRPYYSNESHTPRWTPSQIENRRSSSKPSETARTSLFNNSFKETYQHPTAAQSSQANWNVQQPVSQSENTTKATTDSLLHNETPKSVNPLVAQTSQTCKEPKVPAEMSILEKAQVREAQQLPSTSKDVYCEAKSDWSDDSDNFVYVSDDDEPVAPSPLPTEDLAIGAQVTTLNTRVPVSVQNNLQVLMSSHDDGIWCSKLPVVYKNMFGNPLNHEDFGYGSLAVMCKDLGELFHMLRPDKGDYKLYDGRRPLPSDAHLFYRPSEFFKYHSDQRLSQTEPALPEELQQETVSEISYPPDVIEFGSEISRQFLKPGTKELDWIYVSVGEVYDPSKFWVLLDDYKRDLDCLMDELQLMYNEKSDPNLLIPPHMLRPLLYCAALCFGEYHRAIIVQILDESDNLHKVKVYYIDYGTVATILATKLYFLHKKFAELPQQAVRARLMGIYPPVQQTQWSVGASNRFLELVKQKTLIGQVAKIHAEKNIVYLYLADTSGEDEFYMNDKLVDEEYAKFTYQDQREPSAPSILKPLVKNLYMFPSFDELELGIVPSAVETIRLLNTGIPHAYIYSHYFETPDAKDSKAIDTHEETELQRQKDKFTKSQARRARENQPVEEVHDDLPSTSQHAAKEKENLPLAYQFTKQQNENPLLPKEQKENRPSVNRITAKQKVVSPLQNDLPSFKGDTATSDSKMPQVPKPSGFQPRVRRPPPGFEAKPEGEIFKTTQNLGGYFNHAISKTLPGVPLVSQTAASVPMNNLLLHQQEAFRQHQQQLLLQQQQQQLFQQHLLQGQQQQLLQPPVTQQQVQLHLWLQNTYVPQNWTTGNPSNLQVEGAYGSGMNYGTYVPQISSNLDNNSSNWASPNALCSRFSNMTVNNQAPIAAPSIQDCSVKEPAKKVNVIESKKFGNMQLNVINHNDGQYVSERELISKSLCKETVKKTLIWLGKKDVVLKDQKELSDELLRYELVAPEDLKMQNFSFRMVPVSAMPVLLSMIDKPNI